MGPVMESLWVGGGGSGLLSSLLALRKWEQSEAMRIVWNPSSLRSSAVGSMMMQEPMGATPAVQRLRWEISKL